MEFHHIGIACRDIDTETQYYRLMGYNIEENDFIDTNQGIKGRFLAGGGPRLELVSQIKGSSTLSPWLKSGIKMYHQAYAVHNIEEGIACLQSHQARLIAPPMPAVAFDDRPVCFLMLPTMSLVELIQRG